MNTFLPYPDFMQSAKVLDKKRCWKQCVEAKQIINVLEGRTTAWQNHPAVKMWVGYIPVLQYYFNCFLEVCIQKHRIKTKYCSYQKRKGGLPFYPFWYGNEDFHRAMRARLIEKDRNFYLSLFPDDEGFNDGKYFWPDMVTKTFKIISK